MSKTYYAEDVLTGEMILATRGATATCPGCREPLLGKAGDIITTPYWSHRADTDCDAWAEPMTEWHLGWQKLVTRGRREVTMRRDGLWHRADIVAQDGQVVEIQQSSINPQKISEREQFYGDMVWIWKTDEPRQEGRLKLLRPKDWELPGLFRTFVWKTPWKSIGFCTKPVFFDLGEDWLLHVGAIEPNPFAGWGLLVHKKTVTEWVNDGQIGRPVDPRVALKEKRLAESRRLLVEKRQRELEEQQELQRALERRRLAVPIERDQAALVRDQWKAPAVSGRLSQPNRWSVQVPVLHPDAALMAAATTVLENIYLPQCPTCGDSVDVVGLTHKCRDWHEVCQCGQRYDQPKAKGCRRRKHPKPEGEK